MCGIAGIVQWGDETPQATADRIQRVERMVARIAHRGPDATNVITEANATFGVSRLAIRGDASGGQPVHLAAPGVLLACNGEIDNHARLLDGLGVDAHGRNGNDVWFLPHLYERDGPMFVQNLIGPFALALWDRRAQSLVLARDRVGERSLYYARNQHEMVFASELAALLEGLTGESRVSAAQIGAFLSRGYLPPQSSPVIGTHRLHAAEVATFGQYHVARRRYWRWALGRLPTIQPNVGTFEVVLRTAVRRQCDHDAPFGIFLSGGVDSALIAAMVRDLHRERTIPSFTVRFHENSYDEGDAAQRVADHLALDHHEVWIDPARVPEVLDDLIETTGELLADPAWIASAMLAREASTAIRVALVGEGGDEIFGGYPTYLGAAAWPRYQRSPRWSRRLLRAGVRRLPDSERKVTLGFLLKRFVEGNGRSVVDRHALWTAAMAPLVLGRLGVEVPADSTVDDGHPIDLVQRHDFEHLLAESLLVKSDRACMRSGIESRAPFLDAHVVDFAATLPVDARVHGLRTKRFLKRHALHYLPAEIVHRRKRGLSVPLAAWLRGALHDWATATLQSARFEEVGVHQHVALHLLEEHVARRADHGRALWTMLVLARWLAWHEERTVRPHGIRAVS